MAFRLATLNGSNGFRLDGVSNSDYSGVSVSSAGDVNGDGFDDLIVGAVRADPGGISFAGSSYVVFGSGSVFAPTFDLATLDGSNGFRLDGVAAFDISGESVSSTGDINGDGFHDLIIGAAGASPGGNIAAGSSYVVFGNSGGFAPTLALSTLNGSNGFRLDGVAERDYSGRSVSSAGDVNGDGFDDLIIGARNASPGGISFAGSSYVVFGTGSAFAPTFDLATLDGSNGFRLDGVADRDLSGESVSSAGDVNGDGFDDLIIGAAFADPGGLSFAGSSYVVFGSGGAIAPTFDLAMLTGSNGFRLDGVGIGDYSGWSVSAAGDVNGDGFDDVIIGARHASPGGNIAAGSSYVVFGSGSAFAPTLDLATLDGSNGFRIDGLSASDFSGFSVSAAGDVNGDGFDDIIIGALGADPGGISDAGSSYAVFGGQRVGDGGTFDLGTLKLDGTLGTVFNGVTINDGSGVSVASAGDVNRDGFDDLVIGANRANPGGASDAGSSYVVFGGVGFAETFIGTALDDTINGAAGDDRLIGRGGADILLGGIGDDILLGGAEADVLNGGAGIDTASYFSSTSGIDADLMPGGLESGDAVGDVYISIENLQGSSGSAGPGSFDRLFGNNDANTLWGFAGNDLLFGRAGNDRLFGGTGDDVLQGGLGRDLLNGGAGVDTASYETATTGVRADLFWRGQNQGEAAGDIYGGIESLRGSSSNDVLLGNGGANGLEGLDGDDQLFGRGGSDSLSGGIGADRLGGGYGGAVASDGAADFFVYSSIAESTVGGLGRDTIIDFWRADGDRIDLSAIDADANTAGINDAFTFIGNGSFDSVAGQLRYAAPLNQVQGDVDGDGTADLAIVVDDVADMMGSDFIL